MVDRIATVGLMPALVLVNHCLEAAERIYDSDTEVQCVASVAFWLSVGREHAAKFTGSLVIALDFDPDIVYLHFTPARQRAMSK
jgi:hypothetical protein